MKRKGVFHLSAPNDNFDKGSPHPTGPTLKESTTIAVAQGVVLVTTNDPDEEAPPYLRYFRTRLTKSANPSTFFEQRKFCAMLREGKKSADYIVPDTLKSMSGSSNTSPEAIFFYLTLYIIFPCSRLPLQSPWRQPESRCEKSNIPRATLKKRPNPVSFLLDTVLNNSQIQILSRPQTLSFGDSVRNMPRFFWRGHWTQPTAEDTVFAS